MTSLNPTHSQTDPARMLRLALNANAIFSAASGAVLLGWPAAIAGLIGLSVSWPVIGVGLGLFAYAASLALAARQDRVSPSFAWAAVLADTFWVAASALAIAAYSGAIPAIGEWLIALVAVIVFDFALWQYFGVRKLKD